MSESNDARNVGPAEWLTELLASNLPSATKFYSVMVANCADENGHVWLDDDGMPIPLDTDVR
jgi:hypothetical protein